MRTTTVASVKEVEDQAAAWLIQRDSGRWSEADQQALDHWLEASSAHMVAFIRLETTWQRTDQLKALGAGTPPGVVPSPDEWQLSPVFKAPEEAPEAAPTTSNSRRVPRVLWAMAASVILALAVGFWYQRSLESAYSTPIGGIASMPMTDGSTVILNTDSEVRIALSDDERRVRLDQGEAFFQVAKDPRRPFVVGVDSTRVIAVGTAFSVRRDGDDVLVVVSEGEVKIETEGHSPILASAGSIVRKRQGTTTLERIPGPDLDAALSWRTGFLVFRNTPLADAVTEFNRYNTRKIRIAEDGVGEMRLSGKFRSTQHDAFIRLLEASFPVNVQRGENQVVLTKRM